MGQVKASKPKLWGMFGRIVVGVDAQGTCDHALRAAVELARAFGGRLALVHAVGSPLLGWEGIEDPRDVANDTGIVARAWRSVSNYVTTLLGDELPDGSAPSSVLQARPGRPARVLLEEATRMDADLIVLGYDVHRVPLDFGGTVKHVVAGAPKAVWIQKHAPTPIRRILVGVDLSPDSLLALGAACRLARGLGAQVRVLNAFSNPGYVVSGWADYPDLNALVAIDEVRAAQARDFERQLAIFDWGGVDHTSSFVEGDPALSILDAQRDADLIVLATHGRTGLAAVFLGSVAAHVVRTAHLPVLVVRHPERVFTPAGQARPKTK